MWDDSYDYNPDNRFIYSGTFEYNKSTYYMWKCVGDNTLAILTEERDYSNNNLSYYRGNFSLTPKIVAFLRNDVKYTTGENPNLTYIVNAEQDSICVDQFYDAYAWVLDSNSEGVSLYDYHNGSSENLDTSVVIYTNSEHINIDNILGTQKHASIVLPYKVIDASDPIKQSLFRVHEDGTVYMSKGIVEKGGSIVSSFEGEELEGSVTMNGGSLVYDVSGNGYGGTAIIGYRSARDCALISLYPGQDDPGLYVSRQFDGPGLQIDDCSIEISNEGYINLWDNTYILSRGNAVYKGFKTPITRIESSGNHYISDSSEYHTIVTMASGIALTTSESPAKGTEYDIYVWFYDVNLNLNGQAAVKLVNGTPTEYGINTVITLSKNTYYHIVYDGICWFIHQ